MNRAKFKRLAKKSLKLEPSLIDTTNDDELMERVLKKSAEMQEKILQKEKNDSSNKKGQDQTNINRQADERADECVGGGDS